MALNIAGLMLVLVAIFPLEWQCTPTCSTFTIHGASAILAFLCMAYVAAFRADETLDLIRDPKRRTWYRGVYRALASLMFLSPLAAFALTATSDLQNARTFFVEAFGIFAFSAYWLTKSWEMRETHADVMGLDGTLVPKRYPPHPTPQESTLA